MRACYPHRYLDQNHVQGSVEPRIWLKIVRLGLASVKRPEANGFVYPLFPLSVKELLEVQGVVNAACTLSPMFAAR
jgi:hypothetical protein